MNKALFLNKFSKTPENITAVVVSIVKYQSDKILIPGSQPSPAAYGKSTKTICTPELD